jgi:hypothetical protein
LVVLFDRRCHGVEVERTLKDLKILKVCVFSIDVELHSSHRDIEINAVENLAQSRTMFNAISKVWLTRGPQFLSGEG